MDINKLKELLEKGKSHRQIAEELNIGKSTVGYWIKKLDLESQHHAPKTAYSFDKIDTPEKAYVLGFILADSSIDLKNMVEISIQKKDKDIIDFISKTIDSIVRVDNTYDPSTKRFPRVRTCRKIKDITKFTSGRLKEERHYPRVKKDLERYLLLGFFDADGCITWGHRKDRNQRIWHKVSFTSQLHLLEGIQQMLYNNLNISSIIKPKSNENCYTISFSNKNDVINFINYIYPENSDFIILQRKYLKANALRLELEEFGGTISND